MRLLLTPTSLRPSGIYALLLVFAACATAVAQVRELPFVKTSNTFNKQYGLRFEIGTKDDGQPAVVLDNETTDIVRSVALRGYIVVFGAIGTAADLVTFFDEGNGHEIAELICYNPTLSPDGEYIAFRRFFPRSTYWKIIEDKLAVLEIADLRRPPGGRDSQLPVHKSEDLGHTVYPPTSEPGALFFGKLRWATGSSSFYFIQQSANGTQYIVGRCKLQSGTNWHVDLSNPQSYTAEADPPSTTGMITSFGYDSSGMLVVRFNKQKSPDEPAIQEDAFFNPDTLKALPTMTQIRNGTNADHAVDVPWQVEKQALVFPAQTVPIHAGADLGTVRVRLLISAEGHVTAVEADLARPVVEKIRAAMMSWQFKPTLLNGTLTAITTVAEVPVGR